MEGFIDKLRSRIFLFVIILVLTLGGCTDGAIVTEPEIVAEPEIVTELENEATETIDGLQNESVEPPTEFVDEEDLANERQREKIEANVKEWFLGEKLHKYVGNNRDYDWYIDQGLTGEHSNDNCGPASAVMAMKWIDEDFMGTAEEARQQFIPEGGWWFTSTIAEYFDSHGLDYSYWDFDLEDKARGIEDLKGLIESGNIVLLCVDIGYVSYEYEEGLRINRFYGYDDGHFIIVKGYVEVDDRTYFEVYDSNNWEMTYEDGSPLGKARYYDAEELMDAIYNWWGHGFVISGK